MKKMFTLLVAVVVATAGFAQSRTTDEAKDILKGNRNNGYYDDKADGRYNRDYNHPEAIKRRVFAINRRYDDKISDVRNNRRLSRREKNRIIDNLEDQRRRELSDLRRQVAMTKSKDRRNDRDWDDRRN